MRTVMGYNGGIGFIMPDFKKLITGFLVIAVAASASAFVLSNAGNGSPVTINDGAATDTSAVTEGNAFVVSTNDVQNAILAQDPVVAAALSDPNNLTATFTDAFLNGLSVANPDGLNQDASGTATVQKPATSTITAAFTKSSALKGFRIPNWEAEAAAQKLTVSAGVAPGSYGDALNGIIEKNFAQSGVQDLVGQKDVDPAVMQTVAGPVSDTLAATVAISAPTQLASFHKSLVKVLLYEKNMLAVADQAQADPVKASLIFEAEQSKYVAALQDFGAQSQKASSKGLFSFGKNPAKINQSLALLESYLGIPTAHAQWLTFDPSNFGQWLLEQLHSIVLQILKNTLSAFLQQRVLKWIQGSGAPKFVQQFGTELVSVAQAKAMSAANKALGGAMACPNVGQLLGQTTLRLGLITKQQQTPVCSLTPVYLGQVKNFYKNFNVTLNNVQGGSWNMYAQILNPNANYYGMAIQTNDYVNGQTVQTTQAKQAQISSSQGFKGTLQCDDKSNPNGTSMQCENADGTYSPPARNTLCPAGSTGPGGAPYPGNITACLDGSTPSSKPSCNQYGPGESLDPSDPTLCQPSGSPAVPSDVCGDGSPPVSSNGCQDSAGHFVQPVSQTGSCSDGSAPQTYDNNGECADGSEPRVTTPAPVTFAALNSAQDSVFKFTADANSIVGVLESVAVSFLNTVVQAGVTAAVQYGTQGLTSIVLGGQSGAPSTVSGITPPAPNAPASSSLPSYPPTQCSPHNPNCTSGSSSQCTSGFFGDKITFSAVGGDGLSFQWKVGSAVDANNAPVSVFASAASGTFATFSPYFLMPTSSVPLSIAFPITIPITVTGSDNLSDTCLAIVTQ